MILVRARPHQIPMSHFADATPVHGRHWLRYLGDTLWTRVRYLGDTQASTVQTFGPPSLGAIALTKEDVIVLVELGLVEQRVRLPKCRAGRED